MSERRVKRVLIVAPHFPPSNLAGVHRSRLLSLHLEEFGWEPIIVTVHHRYYEEKLDWELEKLVPKALRVERVAAVPVRPIRLVGDIGIRGYVPLLRRIVKLTRRECVDFLYITIPSNYAALLGRPAKFLSGIPYGIDYIDPWVTPREQGKRVWQKSEVSRWLAHLLEPVAVKRASLITGVAGKYYEGVFERNKKLKGQILTAAMPYGASERDHAMARALNKSPYLFDDKYSGVRLMYAGAMLPRAYGPLECVLGAISEAPKLIEALRINFIGTGSRPNDPNSFNIKPVAQKYEVWKRCIYEHPARIPYIDVLTHLDATDGVFILGSTEPHYTPSKVFQAVLSGKPVFAVLHRESSAVEVIRKSGSGIVLTFDGAGDVGRIRQTFADAIGEFMGFVKEFDKNNVDMEFFAQFSARNMAKTLAGAFDRVAC